MNDLTKTIFHIDVNSAFLSWMAVLQLTEGAALDIRTVPAVVGGDEESRKGIVLASSIPAKRCGVKTGQPLYQARRLCPTLLTVAPDYNWFLLMSSRFRKILYDFSPLVEPFSIDECFLDYTGMEGLFGPPLSGAEAIRGRIKDELGFTVNIGVSSNKLLAKMASDFEKPDRIHTLYPQEIAEKMWPLPVSDLFMVGRATCQKLNSIGIHTIGQLAATRPELLTSLLGKAMGSLAWHYAHGDEFTHSVVKSSLPRLKCISNSTTTPKDVYDDVDAHKTLLALCENVCLRLRRQNFLTGLVCISIRYTDFSGQNRQMKIAATDCSRTIYETCKMLLAGLWSHAPLRQLGISLGDLTDSAMYQPTLFDKQETERLRTLEHTVDSIKNTYGKTAVLKASTLDVPYVRSGKTDFHDRPLTHSFFDPKP